MGFKGVSFAENDEFPLLYLNIAISSIRNNGSDFELLVLGLFVGGPDA